jgi:hypothetical protein
MSNLQCCSRCHHENSKENVFCAQCGNSLRPVATAWPSNENPTKIPNASDAFGVGVPEPFTSPAPQPSEVLKQEGVDLANCPQCGSSQTQSFEMAYSMSTSSGVTRGMAYTFGVGATIAGGRSTQQSNLAAYVRPPIRPTAKYGGAIAVLGILGAALFAGMTGALFESALTPDGLATIRSLVFIGVLIGLISVGLSYQNKKRREWAESLAKPMRSGDTGGFV